MQNIKSENVTIVLDKFNKEFKSGNLTAFQINSKKGMMIWTHKPGDLFGKKFQIYSENEKLCELYEFNKENNSWSKRDFHPTMCGACWHGEAYTVTENEVLKKVQNFQDHQEMYVYVADSNKTWKSPKPKKA